ncbi:MarR family winged helix-turn-helix transcriptional regulator [Martelella sp. HB161492]|uniref:MarR family winged helix-turn-helix transcriptional regulator n=1 Tax=Martelella sp. HB161492 TaxID=2720726 RepID=UPI0015900797|nr:MarR family winged helix-turn-helix transcriptional regulator [Martelella sp. HB161492]
MAASSDPNRLGFLLADVARLFRHAFERAIAEAGLDLTPGEARTLVRVSVMSGARQNVIAEHLGIEPMTLCRYLDRLEVAGLISRTADPSDRRAKVISTTDEADAVLAAIRSVSDTLFEQLLEDFSPEERNGLKAGLVALRNKFATL